MRGNSGIFKCQGRLAVALGAVFIGVAPFAFGQAGASYQLVAFTGQPAPGGGAFSTMDLPKLGADGTVAFIDGFESQSRTPRVVASHFGNLRLVAKAGQPTPDGDGTYAGFSAVSVALDGRVAFNATEEVGEGTTEGIWGEGATAMLPETLVDFGPVGFRAGNIFGVKSRVVVGSEATADALSILSGKGAANPLLEGDPLPGLSSLVLVRSILEDSEYSDPFVDGFRAGTEVDVNESGSVALKVDTTPGPSPTPTTTQGIYAGRPNALQRVATSGEGAPGIPDVVMKDLSPRPSISSNGYVAFSSRLSGSDTVLSAVFAGLPGKIEEIVKASDLVPTATGVVFDNVFSSVVINETGDVIFKARIRYANDTTREGIWIQRRTGAPVLIAADGIQLPTPSGNQEVTAVDFSGPGTFNDLHQFVFRASFASGDGIYLADTRAVAPWVRVAFPRKPRDRVTQEKFITIRGTAEDETGIDKVEYTVRKEGTSRKKKKLFRGKLIPKLAKGDRQWSFKVPLALGVNRITVTATDKLGNVSEPLVLVVLRY